jgi:CYTH domain-containing protein
MLIFITACKVVDADITLRVRVMGISLKTVTFKSKCQVVSKGENKYWLEVSNMEELLDILNPSNSTPENSTKGQGRH